MDVESTVTREVVVRPAHEPAPAVVEWLAEELEKAPASGHSMSPWGPWPAHGWPNGRSRVWTSSHVLGRTWVRFYEAGFHVGLGKAAGDLSGWPARPAGPRPACPVSGCGV